MRTCTITTSTYDNASFARSFLIFLRLNNFRKQYRIDSGSIQVLKFSTTSPHLFATSSWDHRSTPPCVCQTLSTAHSNVFFCSVKLWDVRVPNLTRGKEVYYRKCSFLPCIFGLFVLCSYRTTKTRFNDAFALFEIKHRRLAPGLCANIVDAARDGLLQPRRSVHNDVGAGQRRAAVRRDVGSRRWSIASISNALFFVFCFCFFSVLDSGETLLCFDYFS
jgi:hypothetical protein